jgi:N-acetylglucosamine-6-phosphate deacetylase
MEPGAVLIERGHISAALPPDMLPVPPHGQLIDAPHCTLAPGLIDIHTHGGGGAQAIDGTPEALARLAAFYAAHGVTGFLATVGGAHEHILAGIDAVVAARNQPPRGAAILGLHLEGPFLNPARPGAFRPESIVPPNPALLGSYLERGQGLVRLITLAPELSGAADVIRLARAHDVVCGAGHTQATWDEMQDAMALGVSHVIHTFNAMAALHHREPGVLGATLADERLTAEIIADGIHVHPGAVRLLVRAKGADGVALITDSIGAAGMPDGEYAFEEQAITVAAGAARLADGTLAGSMLTMDQGVANLLAFGAADLAEAVIMGSTTPAHVLGLHGQKGQIAPGADADLVAFDDQLQVRWAMVGGEVVFRVRC